MTLSFLEVYPSFEVKQGGRMTFAPDRSAWIFE